MTTRRLAAILAADVVGFSALMGKDDEGTLATIKNLRREVIEPKVQEHHGRIFKITGDGFLVEFQSPVEAVRCAVGVQEALASKASQEPSQGLQLRIGINLGDIIIEDDGDVYGDGVNIAARLEQLAEPGGLSISGKVYEEVRDKLPYSFEDRGEQHVKNIARPVRIFTVAPGSEVLNPALTKSPFSLPDTPSIAVLPFANMNRDPEQDYFADGVTEDIITGLSRLRWLFVIARHSTADYKGRDVDVQQVGRELGVRYILEGSVRTSQGRVRITTKLLEADSRRQIWAERYDRAAAEIFALQDEITISTVAAIEPRLRQAEIERVRRKRPESLGVYDLVLRAVPYVDTGMPEGALQALPLLDRALALEPDFALAHGQAALCHEILYVRAGRQEANRRAAIHHGHTAISLGPDDATALTYGGLAIGMVEHDRALAIEAFETALALSPSAASAYLWGSLILGWGGDANRAIEWGERGIRLSPFDPWLLAPFHGMFLAHFLRGQYEGAATAVRRAIRSKPGHSISYMMLAAALVRLGRLEEATAAADRLLSLQPNFTIGGQLSAVGAAPELAEALANALHATRLPD